MDFPLIRKVALDIAYDSGVINRHHPEAEFLSLVEECLGADGVTQEDLQRLEAWLGTLTEEQQETLAMGEHEDIQAIRATAPTGGPDNTDLTGLFDTIFERM